MTEGRGLSPEGVAAAKRAVARMESGEFDDEALHEAVQGRVPSSECQVVEMVCGYPMPCPHHGEPGCSPTPEDVIAAAFRHMPHEERPGDKTPGEIARLVLLSLARAGYIVTAPASSPSPENETQEPVPLHSDRLKRPE